MHRRSLCTINSELLNERRDDSVVLEDFSEDSMSISEIFSSLFSVEVVVADANEQISVRISR